MLRANRATGAAPRGDGAKTDSHSPEKMPRDIAASNKSFQWRVAFEGWAWGCLFAAAVGVFLFLLFFNLSPVTQMRGFILTYGGEGKGGLGALACEGHGEINYRGSSSAVKQRKNDLKTGFGKVSTTLIGFQREREEKKKNSSGKFGHEQGGFATTRFIDTALLLALCINKCRMKCGDTATPGCLASVRVWKPRRLSMATPAVRGRSGTSL